MCGFFREKEGQPAPSGVGGEEITETTRDELLVGRGRTDVRDSEWSGRRGLFLGKLETIRDYGKNMRVRHIGSKGSGLRLMQHDAEWAIVANVSIFVMMEFQPEGEGRQQQDESEGPPSAQPLMRGRSGHVRLKIPSRGLADPAPGISRRSSALWSLDCGCSPVVDASPYRTP